MLSRKSLVFRWRLQQRFRDVITHRSEEIDQPGLLLMAGEVLRPEGGDVGIHTLFCKGHNVVKGILTWRFNTKYKIF